MSALLEALRLPARSLLGAAGLPLAAHDPSGRIVFANAAFAELFAADPAELVGRRVQEWVPPDQSEIHGAHLAAWARGEASVFELALPCFGRRCLLVPGPLHDRAGHYLGVIVLFLPHKAAAEAFDARLRAAAGLVEAALSEFERVIAGARAAPAPTLAELCERDGALAQLSEREREVTERLLAGERTDEIARSLAIRPNTVRNHLKAIFRKLGVPNQAALIARVRLMRDGGSPR